MKDNKPEARRELTRVQGPTEEVEVVVVRGKEKMSIERDFIY
jgi:hypothetical protein